MRLRIGLAALVVLGGAGTVAPAWAGETRTLSGPGTSGSEMFVTYVGCGGFFGPSTAPQSRLNLGPQTAPMGRRSLGLMPQGTGTASGPYTRFPSLGGLDAAVSATAAGGTTGVSYIWTITPDSLPGTAWSGRADVAVPAGGWHEVRAADLTYTWSLVDLGTRRPVADGGQATPAAFAAAHGDGQGYVVTGFGCDGRAVNIDAVRSGGTTWDFEGIALSTAIGLGSATARAGDEVTITGTVRDATGRITGDPLVLETRTPGGAWRPVGPARLADPDGITRAEVVVDETADFRWHRPQSQYADEGWSDISTVQVQAPEPSPEPSPGDTTGDTTGGTPGGQDQTDGQDGQDGQAGAKAGAKDGATDGAQTGAGGGAKDGAGTGTQGG